MVKLRIFAAIVAAVLGGSWAAQSAEPARGSFEIQFRTERAGVVSVHIYRADGTLARRLVESKPFAGGGHKIVWDGRAEDGAAVEPGASSWRALFHEGIGLKLRGWVANGSATPWPAAGAGDWGGDAGVPSAVAADAQQVYLGWSLADQGKAILACDLDGRVRWSHRRAEGPSGCKALAMDDGLVYVLGGLAGTDAEGGAVYRLDARNGNPVPWPNGRIDLKIASFWPADAKTKPDKSDAMAVRHDRIFLSFTSSEFLTVLDAKTGAYLQTVVGAPPGPIDIAPTKTDLPDAPGKLVDADFAVIALRGGVLGKVLFAHDPLWVVTSELSPVERDVRINALTVIGDGAKWHRHTAFVGLDAPLHQVHARPLLETEAITWAAGAAGGRPLLGPWRPDALRAIRGVALDAAGKLWVAEGDGFPKRFSVWDATGAEGRLVREFFGPADAGASGAAINPLDPDLMFAQGCEWRIDPQTAQAQCLGVVTRDRVVRARYGVGENGHAYLVTEREDLPGGVAIYERLGDGDYRLRSRLFARDRDQAETEAASPAATELVAWADENDDAEIQSHEIRRGSPMRISAEQTGQDLTLQARLLRDQTIALQMAVEDWSPCGAPRYLLSNEGSRLESQTFTSADGKSLVAAGESLSCRDTGGKVRWRFPNSAKINGAAGVARLPPPLGNVWMLRSASGELHLFNEDGFHLSSLGAATREAAQWPKNSASGVDLSRAWLGHGTALVHAVDGRLYLQAGDTVFWNLEVSGLEKVQALTGGEIVVPPAR